MHLYSSTCGRSWDVDSSSARGELLGLSGGTLVVAESAHLAVARTRRSLAQPFSADDLLDLYSAAKSAGITIKLFPHYHSGKRAREWAAARFPEIQPSKKTDAADAMALALYVVNCNEVSLADPPLSFARCPKRDFGKAVREYSSVALNAERTTGYAGRHMPSVVELGLGIYRARGRSIGEIACYSIASLIVTDVDAVPMVFVMNGSPPGVETWSRNVALMTPFHHDGGVARSNLMKHSFKPFLWRFGDRSGVAMGPKKGKLTPFGHHDDAQSATRTRAMKLFRDTIKACYRKGVEIATERGFAKLDPVAVPWGRQGDPE
jgi:hypothetical protein